MGATGFVGGILVSSVLFILVIASFFFMMQDTSLRTPGANAPEQLSPSDWILEEQIAVYPDRVVLDIENVIWSSFADTNSMDPFLDHTAHGLELKPESADTIQIGDIIAYKKDDTSIIHRVIEKGEDEQGTYFIAKGDNNNAQDPKKIRFDQIQGVLIGILY